MRNLVKHAVDIKIRVPIEKKGEKPERQNVHKRQQYKLHIEVFPKKSDSFDIERINMLPGFGHKIVILVILNEAQVQFAVLLF